jgi:hypothetical protein
MLYDRTANFGHDAWDFLSAFKASGNEHQLEHAEAVRTWLVSRGLITADKGLRLQESYPAQVTDFGKLTAIKILAEREPKSLMERLQNIPRSDWIALAALLVSIIALVK